jgi:hypothetical protein
MLQHPVMRIRNTLGMVMPDDPLGREVGSKDDRMVEVGCGSRLPIACTPELADERLGELTRHQLIDRAPGHVTDEHRRSTHSAPRATVGVLVGAP